MWDFFLQGMPGPERRRPGDDTGRDGHPLRQVGELLEPDRHQVLAQGQNPSGGAPKRAPGKRHAAGPRGQGGDGRHRRPLRYGQQDVYAVERHGL